MRTFFLYFLKEIEGVNEGDVHAENMRILVAFVELREVWKHWKDTEENIV